MILSCSDFNSAFVADVATFFLSKPALLMNLTTSDFLTDPSLFMLLATISLVDLL